MNRRASRKIDRRTRQMLESADYMLSYAQMALQNKTQKQLKLYISQSVSILRTLDKEKCEVTKRCGKERTLFYAMISQLLIAYQQHNLKKINNVRSKIHQLVD